MSSVTAQDDPRYYYLGFLPDGQVIGRVSIFNDFTHIASVPGRLPRMGMSEYNARKNAENAYFVRDYPYIVVVPARLVSRAEYADITGDPS